MIIDCRMVKQSTTRDSKDTKDFGRLMLIGCVDLFRGKKQIDTNRAVPGNRLLKDKDQARAGMRALGWVDSTVAQNDC